MKKLKLNLSGAKELNRAQQRSINGGTGEGGGSCGTNGWCTNECCSKNPCVMGQTCKSRYCGGYPDWTYCG